MEFSNEIAKQTKRKNIHNLIHQLKSKSQSKIQRTFDNLKHMQINSNNIYNISQRTENSAKKTNETSTNMKFVDFPQNSREIKKNIYKKDKNLHTLTFFKFYESNIKKKSHVKYNFKNNNLIKNKIFSFGSQEKIDKKSIHSTQLSKKKCFNTIGTKHKKRNIFIKNYKIKNSLNITRPKYLTKLNDPSTLIPCFNFLNTNKKILNLTLDDLNGKNILFSPLKTLNYDSEIKNLGTKYITPDKYYNLKKNNKYPYFLEKTTSYKILKNFRIGFDSFSEKSKCQKYMKGFDSLISISKL